VLTAEGTTSKGTGSISCEFGFCIFYRLSLRTLRTRDVNEHSYKNVHLLIVGNTVTCLTWLWTWRSAPNNNSESLCNSCGQRIWKLLTFAVEWRFGMAIGVWPKRKFLLYPHQPANGTHFKPNPLCTQFLFLIPNLSYRKPKGEILGTSYGNIYTWI
jgi:hypothetical protein